MMLRKPGRSRGGTVVEFALVFPMMLFLIFAILEFGRYAFVQHTLQYATREGVRLALVGRTITGTSGSELTREASIVKRIQDCAAVAVPPARLSISIYPINADYSDPTGWSGTQDAGMPGSYMRVRTRYDYQFITPFIGGLFTGGHVMVEAQSTYRNELYN
jgi:Flp pilus assembly protein TadG